MKPPDTVLQVAQALTDAGRRSARWALLCIALPQLALGLHEAWIGNWLRVLGDATLMVGGLALAWISRKQATVCRAWVTDIETVKSVKGITAADWIKQ